MRIKFLFNVLRWKLGLFKNYEVLQPPQTFVSPSYDKQISLDKPNVVWINHSSFLITVDGISILTDPIWSTRCSPINFIGPKRNHAPSILLEKLPKIDFVLISHNHYDHLDYDTICKLDQKFPKICWIVPKGVKKWFEKRKILNNVKEIPWWEMVSFPLCDIYAVPSKHFSGRGLFDFNKSTWNGYVIEFKTTHKKCYFAGDTGYHENYFKKIGECFKKIDLGLIPIGAYEPYSLMKDVHVNPNEAVLIHKEVNSAFSLGMHWKTFKLSDEFLHTPPYELYLALKRHNVRFKDFLAIDPGVYVNW